MNNNLPSEMKAKRFVRVRGFFMAFLLSLRKRFIPTNCEPSLLFTISLFINQTKCELALHSPTVLRTVLWILFALYFVWFIFLFSKGIQVANKIKGKFSDLIGTIAFFAYQLVFLVFNR